MWVVQVALVAWLLAPSGAYFFEPGYSHHYTYSAENTLFDQHNVTTVLKFHVITLNRTEEGHRLQSLHVDSLVQYVKDGVLLNNPMQWNLSKTFLFLSEANGRVRLVHCHPEDHEELLVIKKAMVSVFSVHVQIEEDKEDWAYSTHEEDHLGSLAHNYTAQRTRTGLQLQRSHHSANEVFRNHDKTLHYDHQGTLHTALATDRILLKDRSPKHKPTTLPGEKPHAVVSSGDFPDIEARATVKVTLDRKLPHRLTTQDVFHNLTTQTLETKLKPEPSHGLSEVQQNISRVFQCLRQFPEKDNENRSICINDLRDILHRLHHEDYVQFVNSQLGAPCPPSNDTSCQDQRRVLIDVVARLGDVTSQELLMTHVLTKEPAVSEELRRVFIHCVAMENPTEAFIQSVEKLCFGPQGEHQGRRSMTRTQSRACLAVGSLARNSQRSGQHSTADRLVDRLETWLDHHAAGDPHVSKRDTWLEETEHEAHHVSKAVLLHALGNAALSRSRRSLVQHAAPNRGHPLWRRAALDAMRHYNCLETAQTMLAAMMHDDKHTVRQTALNVYVTHPRRHEASRDYENIMMSENYTYPAVARVKRSLLDKVLLRFKVALPKMDWKKELGSKAVGASFGLYFENGIQGLFRMLNGYVDLTIHDKVWAEVHLGIINKQWDILLIEACYKGRLSYNINIMKDFSVNLMKDIAGAFDHIANKIIEPMEKTANELAKQYQDTKTNQPISGFEPLSTAVKGLPKKTEQALQTTVALSEAADGVRGLPLISKVQQLAARAQSLMEDVHSEATDMFANIKDAAVVALPFAEKEIRGALNTVLDQLGDVSQHPRQVFSAIERSKMGFHLAMQRIFESKSIIKQATSFLTGSRSSFMNAGQELGDLAASVRDLVQRLRADHARRRRAADPWTDTADLDSLVDSALKAMLFKGDAMANELDHVQNGAKELQEGMDKQALYTEVLKASYQGFKEAIDMVKSRISALFGQKFHPKFPDQRRDCDGTCQCGYYPSDRYGHPGVDLKWDAGWRIISPVAGLAKPAGVDSVSIQPATSGFTDYEVILSNIRLTVALNATGTFVDAGQVIGVSAGSNGCDDSHFHLAMKRTAKDLDLCYYVDPSPFLDRMQPIPKWHQECKDFTFKHIGNVVDFDKLTEGFSEFLEELVRFATDVGKDLLLKAVSSLPNTGLLGPMKSLATELIKNVDLDPANLKKLFENGKSSMKDFFHDISSKNFSLSGVMDMVHSLGQGLTGSGSSLSLSLNGTKALIDKAKNLIKNPPLAKLKSLAMGGVSRLLSRSSSNLGGLCTGNGSCPGCSAAAGAVGGVLDSALQAGKDELESLLGGAAGKLGEVLGGEPGAGLVADLTSKAEAFLGDQVGAISGLVGDRLGMLNELKTSACNVCPSLGSALARLSGSMCIPHEDCLGVTCDVTVQNMLLNVKVNVTVRVHPVQRKVTISVDGQPQELQNEVSKTLATKIKVLTIFEVRLKVKTAWTGTELRFTLGVEACAVANCLPEISLFRNVTFLPSTRRKRSIQDLLGVDSFLDSMESLPLEDVGKMFSDFNFPMDGVVDQITGIQDQISSALETSKDQTEPSMTAEFINPKDHIDKGGFPAPDEDGELYIPFFVFKYIYPLGPVTFVMDFNAGGAFAIEVDVKVQALDSLLKTTVKPWVSGKFQASMSLSIVVASAGIDLIGWVMKTGFPLTLTSNFNKQPVITKKALELELIPIELKLQGWVKILFIINIKKTIWHYRAPALKGLIWEKVYKKDDQKPPRFPLCNARRRRRQTRSSGSACSVYQVKGRHPKDAAFKLEFEVEDDGSDLKLSYAVGDYPGGTNVQGWTTLRGSSLLTPAEDLPCGIPLYFLVKARNSQGLETTASCSIPTLDCTFPDGRVDAAHRCSSHPSSLQSMVIMFEDSELQSDRLYHGVGYSPSSFGHELVDWQPLTLHGALPQPGASGDLRYFSAPRPGRLSSRPQKSTEASSALSCATQCLQVSTCVSFVHNKHLRVCELHRVTEGPNAERKPAGEFQTYERLGTSLTATLRYENLSLRHGTRYYVNAAVENVLGYDVTLSSHGTMVDRTPPEPGPVGQVISDDVTAEGCAASILQRCEEHVPGSLNHRRIVDGADGSTVLTGNRRGQQMHFTIENYHAAVNWDGFKDKECGIHGYTWAVGRTVCAQDVVSFVDPHASTNNPEDWTYTGLAKELHLADGAYYVTVQAVSDIVHGGDLVTTVCHSTPFVVDTTPPTFHAVQEFLFDESFRFLVVYYNVSDAISGVARMEMGLGRTKYDVKIRRYLPFEMRGVEGNTYLVNEEFETQDGIPAWIRLKVVNNVGLSATGASISPIIVDSTPPVPGDVMDGTLLGRDICCQMSTTEICAQWENFHDPDSTVESYDWGVGHSPGKDDVVLFRTFSSHVKESCVNVTLHHNVTYFSTVVANNRALNTKSSNASSDGLLIDVTPPEPGTVSDGSDVIRDVNYTSETATVTTSWTGFHDGESGLADYNISVLVNGEVEKEASGLSSRLEMFTDHSLSLRHQDTVVVHLQANNRAGGQVTVATDGMLVDHTPPQMMDIATRNRSGYQFSDDVLQFVWNFVDPESGVAEYRYIIFQLFQGRKTKFLPGASHFQVVRVNESAPTDQLVTLENLRLQNGASYSVQVTALNRAKMAATHESEGVTVDSTPPVVLTLTLSKEGEEEETDDNDVVIHVDQEPLWVTWSPHDTQSGIKTSHVCVGPAGSSACLLSGQYQTVDAADFSSSASQSVSFRDLHLQVTTDTLEIRYQAYVITFNGAGVPSTVAASKPFVVLKANIAGVVLDGRDVDDIDYSNDKASIAMSFSGFSSEACGIVGYEWGVGTSPFATDLLPYTDYGLVVDDAGQGFAQVHVMQEEGQKYYSTVRAKTGHNCHEPYIVSSSDGCVLDTTPPTVSFRDGSAREVTSQDVVYQTSPDHLDVLWKAEDPGVLEEVQLVQDFFGSSPRVSHVQAVLQEGVSLGNSPSSGDSLYASLILADNAGNERTVLLPAVVWDMTPPSFLHLNCSEAVSAISPLLHCSWDTVREPHSRLSSILVGLGSGPSEANLMNMTSLHSHRRSWSYDVLHLLEASDIGEFYILVQAVNAAGLRTEEVLKVISDITPPTVDDVTVVTSPYPGFHDVRQQCQTSQDYIEVLLTGLADPESGLRSVELALGSSEGRSDVTSFREWREVNGLYVMENLALSRGAIIYVTARITNSVGLFTTVTSNAVVISPEPRLEVTDGPGNSDMDGQFDVHVLQGHWWYSDPCPVLRAEWSVQELGSPEFFLGWTPIDVRGDKDSHFFYNDRLRLENFRTYVNTIRITDALNRTRVAFSDGVTVLITLPDVGVVSDGAGQLDVEFQEDTLSLAAHWDVFGDPRSTLPSDHIIRYEAAVGTDRRLSSTRSDIHGFEDVGLSTNVTFHGLNLTAKTQTYYVTVRAYSAAGSYAESSSDGVKVGFSADVTRGRVQALGYQSSTSSVRFAWAGFDSDMVITHYYAGVGSLPPPWDNGTYDCFQFLREHSSVFDVRPLQVLEEESMAVLEGLSLKHGAAYYVTVVAADKMGHCSAAASGPIVVDTTAPERGEVKVEGHDAGTVLFIHSPHTLTVLLGEFPDPESGVDEVSVTLISSESCDPDANPGGGDTVRTVGARNQSDVTMRGLELRESLLYFVRVSVTNRAGLTTRAVSVPLLLDTRPPMAGVVKLGEDWTGADRTFQRQTDTVAALVALQSSRSAQDCVSQEDLLTENVRKGWTGVDGQFSPDCVGFDRSGLHVIVQHSPHLTGLDKGAAQFGPTAWREGDYQFRVSPAVQSGILSGLSLASPTLRPPFLRQNGLLPGNQSSLPCDSSDKVCLEDKNQTISSGFLNADTDYGIGLTFLHVENRTKLLFWTQDVLQLKQSWVSLDEDTATSPTDYTLRLTKRGESGSPLWEVSVLVSGDAMETVSGLLLPEDFVLTVYGWNVGGYIPSVVDPLQTFRVATVLENLSLPVVQRPLCSYGSAFMDVTSDVKEVWVGISDSYNVTSNVAPHTLVRSFCLPCLHQCPGICSTCPGDHLSDQFTVVPLTLKGLVLQAGDEVFANSSLRSSPPDADNTTGNATGNTTELDHAKKEFSQYQLPTYYLDVRVVDHSGLETRVKSAGFVVDTSPPVFTSVVCFNPEYSRDVEITQLGNNHTVGVTWEVSEDISDISEIQVYLGTDPGLDDAVGKMTVSKDQDQYVFDDLEAPLEEDKEYYITVEAENKAGLRSKAWSNFTVHTTAPDLSNASVSVGNMTEVQVGEVPVGILQTLDNLELNLDVDPSKLGSTDVEYYELALGTAEGRDDLFPRTVAGPRGTRKIAIVDGFVQREDSPVPISVGDYAKSNWSTSDLPDPSANLLNVEPGRCLRVSVYGVSKAHVASRMGRLVCVKRPGDVLLTADGKPHTLRLDGSVFRLDPNVSHAGALSIKSDLTNGGLLVGVLNDSDVTDQYGSSASTEFSPFVAQLDPNITSRWLTHRLVPLPSPDIFLSPMADAEFSEDIDVSYTVPRSVLVPKDAYVALVFWNPVTKVWEAAEERCPGTAQSYDRTSRVLTAKLCTKLFSEASPPADGRRRKRSTVPDGSSPPVVAVGPRMLTAAIINASVPNRPPVLHNASFTLLEDGGIYNFTLTYTDPEGDDVTFRLLKPPAHGVASVTPEGKITYVPDADYSGKDVIYLEGKEVLPPSALGIVPNVVTFSIPVNIIDVNDPPDIFYLPSNSSQEELRQERAVGPAVGNGLNMTVYKEANGSSPLVLGIVAFADVDTGDTVDYFSTSVVDPGVTFTEKPLPTNDARLSDLNLTGSQRIGGKEIALSLPASQFAGHVTYDARVKDAAGAFSRQLTLNVFVLLHPCVHGVCQPRGLSGTCDEPRRAFTFDPYKCRCDLGYEGEWCQTETDECRTATCSPITDCVDLIGGYRCDVNTEKMAAIIVCCSLAVTLAVVAVCKLKKRSSKIGAMEKLKPSLARGLKSFTVAPQPSTGHPPSEATPSDGQDGTDGEGFLFMHNPFFSYNPRQNPANVGLAATLKETAPTSTGVSQGKEKLSGWTPIKGKGQARKTSGPRTPSNVGPSFPPGAGHGENSSSGLAPQKQCAGKGEMKDAGDGVNSEHDQTQEQRPNSVVRRRSLPSTRNERGVVIGRTAEPPEMTKVEM